MIDPKLELDLAIAVDEKKHASWGELDACAHEFLQMSAAFAGFGALLAGIGLPTHAWVAGVLGAIPSVATTLSKYLNCVPAINWNRRFASEARGQRLRLKFENADVAVVSKDWRAIRDKLRAEREQYLKQPKQAPPHDHGIDIRPDTSDVMSG